ncbi:MAG: phosphoribosylanthranilate isomerase [Arenicellales bacterium]
MRTRIKICGITRAEDAAVAVEAGADAIGLIFFPGSRRAIDLGQAVSVAQEVPPLVDLVGVFVDPAEPDIAGVLDNVPLTALQFHGSESVANCERYGLPYIKAIRMMDEVDPAQLPEKYPSAGAFLLDTYHRDALGGTGVSFDWGRARIKLPVPVILAGGLHSGNVGEALGQCGAWAVDVSTGVECERGRKSPDKIRAFCEAVTAWDMRTSQVTEGAQVK